MAEGKRSFILYCDYYDNIKELTDTEAGRLFKHIFAYCNDENPDLKDKTLRLAFNPIKQQLKRDLVKWNDIRTKRSNAGKASAESRKQALTNSTSVKSVKTDSTNPTVNVTVNDNVSVNVNDIKKKTLSDSKKSDGTQSNFKLEKQEAFPKFWDFYNHKTGKKKSESAFLRLKRADFEKIKKHISNYISCTYVTGRPQPFKSAKLRMNPATYLNGEHWNDEPLKKPLEQSKVYRRDGFEENGFGEGDKHARTGEINMSDLITKKTKEWKQEN